MTAAAVTACQSSPPPSSTAPAALPADSPARIAALLTSAMNRYHLQAVIARVTVDGSEVYMGAMGSSMTGVPATTAMHFRNGAVAFTYIGEMLAILAGRGKMSLDDRLSKWLPNLPHANDITLRMLASMTSGYADYVYQDEVLTGTDADPFRQWTNDELIDSGVSEPLMFVPGKNWGYSHTNYLVLGQVIEKITGQPLATVMADEIFTPMGLTGTTGGSTAELPEPALHSYSSERKTFLHIPADVGFYEDSTFWNPSWTTAAGAVQSTTITDLATTAQTVGSGALVPADQYRQQVGNLLVGVGSKTAECPVCNTITADRGYGLGVLLLGKWIAQTKNFAGEGASMSYLPDRKIAIAVVTTLRADAYDDEGVAKDPTMPLLRSLAAVLAPDSPAGPS